MLVHELDVANDAKGSVPVAFFRAPENIRVLDCAGDQIAVGCDNGEVLHLRAAVLIQGTSS